MRRLLLAIVLFAVPVAAIANGFGGSDAPTRIPVPARVFEATFRDLAGTEIVANRFTWNGEVYIQGRLGDGWISVPFERVAEATVEPTGTDDEAAVKITLHDGSTTTLVVDDDTPCYGETKAGLYMIEVGNLRSLRFTKLPKPKDPPPTP